MYEKTPFWQDRENELIQPDLFSTTAENFAKRIARDNHQKPYPNKPTQIRRFFDEVVRFQSQAAALHQQTPKNREKEWNTIQSLLHMMVAKAAYAQGRDLISPYFLEFIRTEIPEIKTPKDLKLFASFFEAFMGFYKLHGPKKG